MYVYIYAACFTPGGEETIFEVHGFGDGSHITPQEGDLLWIIPI
jgi:hypothetical protein